MHSPRNGRLNTTTWIDATTIQKVAKVIEPDRPIRLGVEAWALTVAKGKGLAVPAVYSSTYDSEGREVLRLERIEGTSLDRISDHKLRARAMFDVGRQLLALTDVAPTFGWIDIHTGSGSHPSWRQFLVEYVDRFAAILVQSDLLASDLGHKLLRMTQNVDDEPTRASLVHRDIKPGNVLLRPDGGVALIDWENAILGDSLYDLALYEIREGRSLASAELIRGYEAEAASTTEKYRVYMAIALLGITDFLRAYNDFAENQAARLGELIEEL